MSPSGIRRARSVLDVFHGAGMAETPRRMLRPRERRGCSPRPAVWRRRHSRGVSPRADGADGRRPQALRCPRRHVGCATISPPRPVDAGPRRSPSAPPRFAPRRCAYRTDRSRPRPPAAAAASPSGARPVPTASTFAAPTPADRCSRQPCPSLPARVLRRYVMIGLRRAALGSLVRERARPPDSSAPSVERARRRTRSAPHSAGPGRTVATRPHPDPLADAAAAPARTATGMYYAE